ncbi:MAG TPA: acylphosphatase, partial [Spirochaetia bacterium]|nr:acylphosphatase [Spirochaetia bacterium]
MPAGAEQAVRAVVHGRVQGVGFRWSALREARRLGLRGTVGNRGDGTVEVVAEGDATAVDIFLAWLRRGPPGAHVTDVTVDP